MKKEVFLAVSVGFILGLLITFGIWTANRSLRTPTPQDPTPTPQVQNPTPTSTPNNAITLTVTSPEDESISSKNSITITGKTLANTPLVITSEKSQDIVVSDASGNFSAPITLEGGYNQILITATDANGNSASTELLITYTTSTI